MISAKELILREFHQYPTDCHTIEDLRRFLRYFRAHENDGGEAQRYNMRAYQRRTESVIARRPDAHPIDLANLRFV